jgi:DNA-binding response OmpR family regulator
MRVLVADDDPVYRTLLEGLLTEWHFEAVLVEDGLAAWEILQQDQSPGIAILDWSMPFMDGCQVCHLVRQKRGDSLPYILLMTSNDSREDLLRVVIAGADDYLLKPFEPLDLKIRLRIAVRIVNLEDRTQWTTAQAGGEHAHGQ